MKKVFIIILLVAFAVSLIYENKAAAQDDQETEKGISFLGQWKALPLLAVESTYNDNINLTAENEEDDLITIITPALSLEHSLFGRGAVSLGYGGYFAYYSDNSDNDWQTDRIDFNLNYQAPSGLIIDIVDSFNEAEDPGGTLNEYGEGERKERWSNNFRNKIGYDFRNRLRMYGIFSFYRQDYDDDILDWSQDYDEKEYGFSIELRILPKTWSFMRFFFGETDYTTVSPDGLPGTPVNESNDADSSWKEFGVGLTTDPTSKLQGELNFGYTWFTYDNDMDKDGKPFDDNNTWIARTNIEYLMSPKTTWDVNIMRAVIQTGSNSKEFFERLDLGVSIRHKFFTKFFLKAGVNYRLNDYNTSLTGPERADERYDVKLGLNYQINRWFTVGTKYNFIDKDSNYPENNYTNNRFTITLIGSI